MFGYGNSVVLGYVIHVGDGTIDLEGRSQTYVPHSIMVSSSMELQLQYSGLY